MLHGQHMNYFLMSDANYCFQMTDTVRDQLCPIVTRGFNVEGPPARISRNTRMWTVNVVRELRIRTTFYMNVKNWRISTYDVHNVHHNVDIRQAVFDEVKNVWKDSSNEGRPTLSVPVPLFLAPYSGFQLTTPQCHQIVSATFEYIENSPRCL